MFEKKFISSKKKIDFTIILTPNYTHFRYIKFALSNGSNVICEKPLVLTSHHLQKIRELEQKYNKRVFTVLQLRTLKVIKDLFKKIKKSKKSSNVKINYITPRNESYLKTWKGDPKKSGGIIFNIGIHLLDLLCYLFGKPIKSKIVKCGKNFSRGEVIFKNAKASYFLSIREKDVNSYSGKN